MTHLSAGSTSPATAAKTLKNGRRRLPPWLTKRAPCGGGKPVRSLLDDLKLNTVCGSARCPNQLECFGKNRATFLIMGPHCSRLCRFCAVSKQAPVPLDSTEPERVAEAVVRLELKHAVVTSVTRDDLPDGGASHFADTIRAIRRRSRCSIEVLTPDFQGSERDLALVASAEPEIFNHNVETAERLYSAVRPQANYQRSLKVFRFLRKSFPALLRKSGIMVGMGEEEEEVISVLNDLHDAGCQILTIGQYLAPTPQHYQVHEYIHPDRFARYAEAARRIGFLYVASAPFVRSSYNAEDVFAHLQRTNEKGEG